MMNALVVAKIIWKRKLQYLMLQSVKFATNVTDGDEYREEISREFESGIFDEVESEGSNESFRRTSD